MNKVKIEITIDLTNPEHVNAVNSIAADIFTGEKTKKKKTKKEPAEEKEQQEEQQEEETEGISILEIRNILAEKVGDHREAIKAKLKELGVKNVSTLDEENYLEIFNFLSAL